jgi:hypothetical protein
MATPKRGAWGRSQRFTPPAGDNPNLGSAVSAGTHLTPTEWQNPYAEPTPTLPATVDYLLGDPVMDYMTPQMPVSYPIDREPEDHESGTVQRGGQDPQTARVTAYEAHMIDRGAANVHHFAEPIERATRDTYRTQRIEADRATSMSRTALVRGRNSLPENNPDGPPPQGHYVMRWIDRQFTRRGIKQDMQPLRPYRAAVSQATPAGESVYSSPYARLANARQLKLTTPQARRVPRPWDDTDVVDGTADPQYTDPQYWTW